MSMILKSRTYDEVSGLVRGITSDGREVLLQIRRRGLDNLTDGGRVHPDDYDWDRRESPIDPSRIRAIETF